MKRRRRGSYKFTEKKHSKQALLSASMAGVCLFIYVLFVYLSYSVGGALSTYFGSFGVLAMMVSMVALGLSIPTLKEEDSFMLFPRLALLLSVFTTLLWIATYIQGFIRG